MENGPSVPAVPGEKFEVHRVTWPGCIAIATPNSREEILVIMSLETSLLTIQSDYNDKFFFFV